MDFTGAGGGLMLAVAAGLWLVYLVPNWLRRKEFEATERNAVRLQRTMRVLAETAEGPVARSEPVESSPASDASVRFRQAQSAGVSDASVRFRQAQSAGVSDASVRFRQAQSAVARQRVRRSRAGATLALLAGLIILIVQVGVSIATGWSPGGVLVAGIGVVLGTTALALLRRLAAVRPAVSAPRMHTVLPDIELATETVVREWTPVPVPRPIQRPQVVPSTMSDPRIAAAAAAEEAERARRGTDREVAPLPAASTAASRSADPAEAPASRPSRYASMGVVGEQTALPDLDAALARRRA